MPTLRLPAPATPLAALAFLLTACGDDGATSSQGSSSEATSQASASSSGDASATSASTSAGTSAGSDSASATGTGTSASSAGTAPETTGTSTSTSAGTTTGTSDGTTGGTTGGDGQVVRFVVLGDTGEGNEDQYMVAQAIVEICAQKGCEFAVLTGDNFYDSGVKGIDDPQWQEKFELPYEDFTFPVYAVLGNHDYGGAGIGVDLDTDKPDYQVEYTNQSQLWKMPAKYYAFSLAHADFWALDTNQVMTDPFNGDSDVQKSWFQGQVAQSNAPWKIAFGHHPYISNGDHGNAGAYENLEGIPFPFVTGSNVKKFMDATICNKIDVYICGHDHNLQWLMPTCGTEFIISGAGSKAETLPGKNPFLFQKAEMEGFIWVELADNQFTGVFYDKTGAELYSRSFTK